ncbi:MAG: Flagellar assembly protein FliX [Alphaproteobacteria bacterium ADurb.Bin438]|nr:MAG: Flagellar assembly protein FliX [Alphaproteobacteria bacterium ADurb.Bin438]
MKIEGTKKNEKVEKSSSKPKLGSGSDGILFASLLSEDTSVNDASPVISTSPLDATNALFATQMAEDATARKARNLRALKKGENLLDRLEEIRVSLISGNISKENIIALGQALRAKRENDLDPKLCSILDEIELRVEVELAKLSLMSK